MRVKFKHAVLVALLGVECNSFQCHRGSGHVHRCTSMATFMSTSMSELETATSYNGAAIIADFRSAKSSSYNNKDERVSEKEVEEQGKRQLNRTSSIPSKRSKDAGLHLPYESAIRALRAYHSIHGDLVIPRRYLVPETDEFPKEWHNIDLAKTVYEMNWWSKCVKSKPDRVYELNQLGFVWERLQPEWNLVLEAMITYSSIYGNVMIPANFIVPHGDRNYPKATWGIHLGNCVHRIRTRNDFLRGDSAYSRRKQLDGLGFVWDVGEYAFHNFFQALRIFDKVQRYNHHHHQQRQQQQDSHRNLSSSSSIHYRCYNRALKVPSTFIVPSGENILISTNTKNSRTTTTITNFDASTTTTSINDNTRRQNQQHYTIQNPWPKNLWGYQLGAKCAAVRRKGLYHVKDNPDRRRALEELGFQWSGNATLGWLEVVHAAAIYSKMHGKKLDVPINFVVPSPPSTTAPSTSSSSSALETSTNVANAGRVTSRGDATNANGSNGLNEDSWPWPEHLWGFPLGQRLKDVRLKGAYLTNSDLASSRRAQLDGLGFVWKPPRGRRR